jgi:hypothetical protein
MNDLELKIVRSSLKQLKKYKEGRITLDDMDRYVGALSRTSLNEKYIMRYKNVMYSTHEFDKDYISNAITWIDSYFEGNIDLEEVKFRIYEFRSPHLQQELNFDFISNRDPGDENE